MIKKIILCSGILIISVHGLGCNNSKTNTSSRSFVITRENADSFDDAPAFVDRLLDQQTSRFSEPERPYQCRYFADGKITVNTQGTKGEKAAKRVADTVAKQIFKDETVYSLTHPIATRFGYYIHADWGSREEGYTGHILKMMIDLDRRIIWYYKCD